MRLSLAFGVLAVAALVAPVCRADTPAEERVAVLEQKIDAMTRAYEARIAALEREVAGLKAPLALSGAATAAPAPTAPAPPAPPPTPGLPPVSTAAPSQTSNYFNPSVSVIGNYLGVGGSNGTENLPSSSLRESEVSLQAVVDPYARADFFISFGEAGVNLYGILILDGRFPVPSLFVIAVAAFQVFLFAHVRIARAGGEHCGQETRNE